MLFRTFNEISPGVLVPTGNEFEADAVGPALQYYWLDPKNVAFHNSGADWALNLLTGGIYRFEVRPGDHWVTDQSWKERSEVAHKIKQPNFKDIWFSWRFMVEPGPIITSQWAYIGQLHQTEDAGDIGVAPPFGIRLLPGDKIEIQTAWTAENPTTQDPNFVSNYHPVTPIERGKWYRIVNRIKFDPTAPPAAPKAWLQSWLNGQQIVNYAGPIGYPDAVGPYLKFGIYRSALNPPPMEKLAVQYQSVEIGTTDLSSRINLP